MQAVSGHPTPNKNRLFVLDSDLQVQIFAYAGLFGDPNTWFNRGVDIDKEASKLRRLFEITRKEAIYYDKLYFIGLYSSITKELSKQNPLLYCRWCEHVLPNYKHHYRNYGEYYEYYKRSPFCILEDVWGDDFDSCEQLYKLNEYHSQSEMSDLTNRGEEL
jgi:hypothetical protein